MVTAQLVLHMSEFDEAFKLPFWTALPDSSSVCSFLLHCGCVVVRMHVRATACAQEQLSIVYRCASTRGGGGG